MSGDFSKPPFFFSDEKWGQEKPACVVALESMHSNQ
jgi:hypothetical protein